MLRRKLMAEIDVQINNKSLAVSSQELDDLIDAEMKGLRTYYVRTSMKKSIRTYTPKLLKKADRNI